MIIIIMIIIINIPHDSEHNPKNPVPPFLLRVTPSSRRAVLLALTIRGDWRNVKRYKTPLPCL
jgi:hypothetical protein